MVITNKRVGMFLGVLIAGLAVWVGFNVPHSGGLVFTLGLIAVGTTLGLLT